MSRTKGRRYRPRRHTAAEPPSDADRLVRGSRPVLSCEQERELLDAYHELGDRDALDALVRANLRFVMTIAHEYEGGSLSLAELYSVGCTGLLAAIDRFDASRGVTLLTYSVAWIRHRIVDALRSNARLVRVPKRAEVDRHRIARLRCQLETERQRYVSDTEAAETAVELGLVSAGTAQRHHLALGAECSLDAPLDSDGDALLTIADVLACEAAVDDDDFDERLQEEVRELVGGLDERQRRIITRHYGLDGDPSQSLSGIGVDLALSRERVRQLHNQALEKLRRAWEATREPGAAAERAARTLAR